MKRPHALRLVLPALLAGALAPRIYASAVVNQIFTGSLPATITGTLPNQNTALEEMFTLTSPKNLTVTTDSYAAGGFEPNLFLFNSAGDEVAAGNPFGSPDPNTGIVGDMQLTATDLAAGAYTVAVTDFLLNQSLTATNLSDGFAVNFGSGTTFVDSNGNTRTGNFAFTINAASAAPEPATLWLGATFLAGLTLRARKRRL